MKYVYLIWANTLQLIINLSKLRRFYVESLKFIIKIDYMYLNAFRDLIFFTRFFSVNLILSSSFFRTNKPFYV